LKHGLISPRKDYLHNWYLKHRNERIQHNHDNIEQRKSYNAEYYKRNKSEINAQWKEYYKENKEKISNHQKEYNLVNKRKVAMRIRRYYEENQNKIIEIRERHALMERQRNLEIKTEVCTHYGNGKCACVRCGFEDIRALSIDHINGCGAERRKRDLTGIQSYKKLRMNNYPDGYQTLCMNCQFIKRIENGEYRKRTGLSNARIPLENIMQDDGAPLFYV